MKKLIDLFAEKVLSTTDSFVIETDEKDGTKTYCFFIQGNVGNARYVYGKRSWGKNDSEFNSNIELRFELVSIISEGNIYVVNYVILNMFQSGFLEKEPLPKNTYRFDDIVKKENDYIKTVVFTNFYNDLEEKEITDENELSLCKKESRSLLLGDEIDLKENDLVPKFTEQDIANSLCGFLNLKTEVIKRLEANKDKLINKKSHNRKVKELMENYSEVETYEIKIAEGLRTLKKEIPTVDFVTVKFELNGKTASIKIRPMLLIGIMDRKDCFHAYNFESINSNEFISMLDATVMKSDNDEKEVLTCKHITKITYKKKVLYVKEA